MLFFLQENEMRCRNRLPLVQLFRLLLAVLLSAAGLIGQQIPAELPIFSKTPALKWIQPVLSS